MLRASSEIAVAMSVASPGVKLSAVATERPVWRAVTMSRSDRMGTRISFSKCSSARLELAIQVGHPFFQVESSGDVLHPQSELHHRERDVGLDPDDDGLRAPQPDHLCQLLQGPGGERIHHV